jgi:ectoine hydroxylase-related dioxygenase (phytanoyl-CoA dioxygenase family)
LILEQNQATVHYLYKNNILLIMRFIYKYWSILRQLKISYVIYNFINRKKLKQNSSYYKKLGINKSVFSPISHKEVNSKSSDIPWLDKPDAKEKLLEHPVFQSFDSEMQKKVIDWIDNGYIILENFFNDHTIDEINAETEKLLNDKVVAYSHSGTRIVNAYQHSEIIKKIMNDDRLAKLLNFILGKESSLFQTLSFKYGSQQNPHSDSFHMTTEPLGYMSGVWIALEDISEKCGPLIYYPKSHRRPFIMNDDFKTGNTNFVLGADRYGNYEIKIKEIIHNYGLTPNQFIAKKGDILIWHSNLLHGGAAIEQKGLTRKSLVGHYFCKDVFCYHEINERPAIINS